jgi:glutaminyl-peptide cyclotransferase
MFDRSKTTSVLILLVLSVNFVIIQNSNLIFASYAQNHSDQSKHTHPASSQIPTIDFNETKAYEYVEDQLNIGYRVPGTTAHTDCANWIRSQLVGKTDAVVTHNFIVQKSGPAYACQNIIGKINPGKTDIVIFGAHWDSRAVAEKDTVDKGLPIPGANDGASGVAVLIELARVLYANRASLNVEVWFLFIDAEDQGYSGGMYGLANWNWCEGSQNFTTHITDFYDEVNENINCFILLDMVGGLNLKFMDESHSSNDLSSKVFAEGRSLGYASAFPINPSSFSIIDDHVYFSELGIPSLDLIIDFRLSSSYHHTHSDDLSHISAQSLKMTGQTLESFMYSYYTGSNPWTWENDFDPFTNIVYWLLLISGGLILGISFIRLIKWSDMRKIQKERITKDSDMKENQQ